MNRQIIRTSSGERLIVLPEAEYDRLIEASEMAADIAAYDAAKAKLDAGTEELLPAEMVKRMLAGESPVRVWREHRGLSARALAERAGVTQSYLSRVEAGKRVGTVETLRKLAQALAVTIDDLVD